MVIFLIDDLGAQDLGCYGNGLIDTPNIDRLTTEGMCWTQAYSACPVCSPTRVAILTGKSPARVRFTGHITAIDRHRHPQDNAIIPPDDRMDIPLEEVTLAEALKPAGYTSAHIEKWHVGHKGFFPEDQGFDRNVEGNRHGAPTTHFYLWKEGDQEVPLKGGKEGDYLADRLTDEAIDFIEENRKGPFFVYLSHYAVHTPLEAPQGLVGKYQKRLAANQRIHPVYAAMVENMDTNVGRILDSLDRLDLRADTLVIFTSDNRPFRLGKGHLYEGGLRIPLIVRWPGKVTAGSVSRTPVISEDLYATVVSVVEGAVPGSPLDGRTLAGEFEGAGTDKADLHWYYPHYAPQRNRPGAAIRSGTMKLIEFYDPPEFELYDLATDPGEATNLAAMRTAEVESLQVKLDAWLDDVNPIRHTANPLRKEN